MTVFQPSYWMSLSITTIIRIVMSFVMVKHEIQKRRQSDIKFTTNSLKYTSISCVFSGLLANICLFLMWFDGLCIFMHWLGAVLIYIQYLSMGFYQLSRLYYSFANNQIHSGKGYGKWVFIIMIIFGIVIFAIHSISSMFDNTSGLNAKCGINSKFEHYFYQINNNHEMLTFYGIFISALLYVLWDLGTLALYMAKIRMFKTYKTSEPIVYKRISSILYKIAIITLFYDITSLILLVLSLILYLLCTQSQWFCWATDVTARSSTILYGVSMMLMMDYNTELYARFLRCIYRMKLYLCCCCCSFMVIEELLSVSVDFVNDEIQMAKQNEMTPNSTMITEDQDIQHIERELSTPTQTVDSNYLSTKL